ncbi:MAG: HAMP domain-containing sensor histidine kinase [bacterium]|nr:HAMP domain-containing sensor histidine kinase [bacterium]
MNPNPRTALILFLSIVVVLVAQAAWWIVFMAKLLDEKVKMAADLGASEEFLKAVHEQEISRQIMLGLEGVFFLMLVMAGAWLIYRALVKSEELKFRQQNFLMAVTHELKTPIASIRIYLDSMQSPKISPEKKNQMIPRMKEDVVRLERLVENVLDAGRFERHGYRLEFASLDLSKLVTDALNALEKIPGQVKLIVTRRIQTPIMIDGDYRALRRAIDAILENSLKYSDKDEIELQVSLTADETHTRLRIKDNGIGLRKQDTTAIFNRFFRVGQELNRSKPGSGLGLYLSKEIIKAHDGTIEAHSEGLGLGAEFEIKLSTDGRN